jgi:hypothetical protein
MRRLIVMSLVVWAFGLAVPAALRASGGPVPPLEGGAGVGIAGHPDRYVTVALAHGTLLERLRHRAVAGWRMLPGTLGVPGAAYDGSMTGLSADGRTLVLAAIPRHHPPRRTVLVVVAARRMHVRERVTLRGFFTVDAISPDGRRLYLLQYVQPGNALRYAVRAYDLPSRRLLRRPIVDPREPGEKMLGIPFSRVMSGDGRWAYTLYQRPGDAPFVHALDTRAGTAACIDLDSLAGADAGGLHLVAPVAGEPLRVVSAAGTQALIDRRTFRVSAPAAAPPATAPASGGGGPAPLVLGALALALVAAWAGRGPLLRHARPAKGTASSDRPADRRTRSTGPEKS